MGLELPGARLIPLAAAGEVIRELLPDLAASDRPGAAFNPDPILTAARAAGAEIEEIPMPRWESLPDAEVYRLLARGWPPDATETVIAIPMDSFRGRRPLSEHALECPQHQLHAVIEGYLNGAGSPFFDGDTLFVCAARRAMLIFHHEERGFVIRGIPEAP